MAKEREGEILVNMAPLILDTSRSLIFNLALHNEKRKDPTLTGLTGSVTHSLLEMKILARRQTWGRNLPFFDFTCIKKIDIILVTLST